MGSRSFQADLELSIQKIKIVLIVRPDPSPGTPCIIVKQDDSQVLLGDKKYFYHHIYGNTASSPSNLFYDCINPLVDEVFDGRNATAFAYGQTGSGKTYTMGTGCKRERNSGGVIPKTIETIFSKIDVMKQTTEFKIGVTFVEVFNNDIRDLLAPKVVSRAGNQFKKDKGVAKLIEFPDPLEANTKEAMLSYLSQGCTTRTTGSTDMNHHSSRSHAIFVITLKQHKHDRFGAVDTLVGKLVMVDLAGSERMKKTGDNKLRQQEGISINLGLSTLGLVLFALSKVDDVDAHVPYRSHTLTHLLEDSLGRSIRKVLIACVSPAMSNVEETTSTIYFVDRSTYFKSSDIANNQGLENTVQKLKDLEISLQGLCGEDGELYYNLMAEWKKLCSVEEPIKGKMDECFVEIDREILNPESEQSNSSTKEEHQQKYKKSIRRKGKELNLKMKVQSLLIEMELNDRALQETLSFIQLEMIQIQSRSTSGCDIESLVKKVREIRRKRMVGEWDLDDLFYSLKGTITEHSPKENPFSSGVIEDMIGTPSIPVASMTSPLPGAAEEQGMSNTYGLATSTSCQDSSKRKARNQIDELTNDVSRLKISNEELKEKLMAEKVEVCECSRASTCKRGCPCFKKGEFCGSKCRCSPRCSNHIPSGPGSSGKSSTATKSISIPRGKYNIEKKIEELITCVSKFIEENAELKKRLKFEKATTCGCSIYTECIRCECRKNGEKCGPGCGCNSKRCTNRN